MESQLPAVCDEGGRPSRGGRGWTSTIPVHGLSSRSVDRRGCGCGSPAACMRHVAHYLTLAIIDLAVSCLHLNTFASAISCAIFGVK